MEIEHLTLVPIPIIRPNTLPKNQQQCNSNILNRTTAQASLFNCSIRRNNYWIQTFMLYKTSLFLPCQRIWWRQKDEAIIFFGLLKFYNVNIIQKNYVLRTCLYIYVLTFGTRNRYFLCTLGKSKGPTQQPANYANQVNNTGQVL